MFWAVRWSVTFPRFDEEFLIYERDPPFRTVTPLDHDANDEKDQDSDDKTEYCHDNNDHRVSAVCYPCQPSVTTEQQQ